MQAVFWFFSTVALLSALGVVFSRQSMMSACWMFALVLGLSGVMASLGAWMLSLITLLVYVGAVLVLFVFVLMFIGQRLPAKQIGRLRLVGALGMVAFIGLLLLPFLQMAVPAQSFGLLSALSDNKAYGRALFTYYSLPTLFVGWMLLWVGVGAIKSLESPVAGEEARLS